MQRNLVLSPIGIGTYLGNADEATDRNYTDAIVRAVQLGVNVIDSAANYRFQRSERSIGSALKTLENEGFAREELVICTKGGYLPFDGAPPRNMREYVAETFVKPGVASFDDIVGGSHCMTPSYLQNQLDQSLRNMDLETVDVYYVHNPESQLDHVSESEFYHRLRLAFGKNHIDQSSGAAPDIAPVLALRDAKPRKKLSSDLATPATDVLLVRPARSPVLCRFLIH